MPFWAAAAPPLLLCLRRSACAALRIHGLLPAQARLLCLRALLSTVLSTTSSPSRPSRPRSRSRPSRTTLHDTAAQHCSGLPPLGRIITTRCAHSLLTASPDLLLRCGESGTTPSAQIVSDAPLLLLLPPVRCDNCLLGECACARGLQGVTPSLTMPLQRQSSRCVSLTMDWTIHRGEGGDAALRWHRRVAAPKARMDLRVTGAHWRPQGQMRTQKRREGQEIMLGTAIRRGRGRERTCRMGLGRDADAVSMCQQATAPWRGAA